MLIKGSAFLCNFEWNVVEVEYECRIIVEEYWINRAIFGFMDALKIGVKDWR
jgi:hypothetical protein